MIWEADAAVFLENVDVTGYGFAIFGESGISAAATFAAVVGLPNVARGGEVARGDFDFGVKAQ